jgi:hypothetical protein
MDVNENQACGSLRPRWAYATVLCIIRGMYIYVACMYYICLTTGTMQQRGDGIFTEPHVTEESGDRGSKNARDELLYTQR